MNGWAVGVCCVLVGLYGTYTAADRILPSRRGLAALGWMPSALWAVFMLAHAWRNS